MWGPMRFAARGNSIWATQVSGSSLHPFFLSSKRLMGGFFQPSFFPLPCLPIPSWVPIPIPSWVQWWGGGGRGPPPPLPPTCLQLYCLSSGFSGGGNRGCPFPLSGCLHMSSKAARAPIHLPTIGSHCLPTKSTRQGESILLRESQLLPPCSQALP